MLILTRLVGESIIIGDDVKVMVLGTYKGQVRIGIEAPESLSVHREEIYKKIRGQQAEIEKDDNYVFEGEVDNNKA